MLKLLIRSTLEALTRGLERNRLGCCLWIFKCKRGRLASSPVHYTMNPSGKPSERVCRKNEFLCANSVMLCVSVVKLPGKTFTTEARSLHREPRRTFSDRLLQRGVLGACEPH